jgi:hypothetical protein
MVFVNSVRGLVITGSCLTRYQQFLKISVSVSVSVNTGIAEQLDSKIAATPYSLVKTE